MLRAKSRSIVDTALSVLETTLVWCRAADASDVGLARTGLFELLLLVRVDDRSPLLPCRSTHLGIVVVFPACAGAHG
jgi:hypothetical protein